VFSRAKSLWSLVAVNGGARGLVLQARDGKLMYKADLPSGSDLAWAYLDPDDQPDVVVVHNDLDRAYVALAQGTQWNVIPLPADPLCGGGGVGVGDIDGDGDIDIVSQPSTKAHRILRNDSTMPGKPVFRVIESPIDLNGKDADLIEAELTGVPADVAPVVSDNGCASEPLQ